MTVSIRLDGKTALRLEKAAKSRGVTKSKLIRDFLLMLLSQDADPSPWQLGQAVFGLRASGHGNLSCERKKILKEKLHAKQSSH